MTNEELENRLGELVRTERKITQEILLLIREADKRRLHLSRVEGMPRETAEKVIAEEFPGSARPKETLCAHSAEESTLTITLNDEAVVDLKRARELLSNALPSGSYADVISRVLRDFVNKADPLKPAADKRRVRVLKRAQGQCEFVDENTNRRCTARTQLEIDHIIPRAHGGTDADENLRVLCKPHNLHEAARIPGEEVMGAYRTAI